MPRAASSVSFDDAVLVLADGGDRFFLLDGLAAEIWRAAESGLTQSQIAQALSRADPAHSEPIERDVSSLLARWSAEGLLGTIPPSINQHSIAVPPLVASPKWTAKWKCRLRNLVFELSVENPHRAQILARLFNHLPTVSEEASLRLEVRDDYDGEGVVLVNGVQYAGAPSLRNLKRALIHAVWPEYALCALIHAGMVAYGGRSAACLAGVSGSGKTTLIAHLASQGLIYLADDLTLMDMSGRMLPWPMPMSIKAGSWNLLSEQYPVLQTAPTFYVKNTEARPLTPSTMEWELGPITAHVLIFPTFAAETSTVLERLTPLCALRRLIQAGLILESPLSIRHGEVLANWLVATPAYSLSYGSLDEAAAHITAILATS